MPLISTDGSLIFEQMSSITAAVFFVSFNSLTVSIPFLPIDMKASYTESNFE